MTVSSDQLIGISPQAEKSCITPKSFSLLLCIVVIHPGHESRSLSFFEWLNLSEVESFFVSFFSEVVDRIHELTT